MELNVIAVDTAKNVFQAHWIEPDTGSIEKRKLKRSQVLGWFANRPPAIVAMEACGGSHEWGRQLLKLGHQVRLLPPKRVRPFVQRNRTDATDAQGIWTACQQPDMRFVPVMTEDQQVVLALHRLRGLLYEFGIVLPEGHRALLKELPTALRLAQDRLPAILIDSLDEQRRRIHQLEADIGAIELRLSQHMRESPACQAAAQIPGVGLLTATAAVATMGSPANFRHAREFAAWVGLAPRQIGTGGVVRQMGISKHGDTYLRTLIIHGARSIVASPRSSGWPWLVQLLKRRPARVAIVAVANKLARTIWAVLARGQAWRSDAWQAA